MNLDPVRLDANVPPGVEQRPDHAPPLHGTDKHRAVAIKILEPSPAIDGDSTGQFTVAAHSRGWPSARANLGCVESLRI
jgi:hypothetical protein